MQKVVPAILTNDPKELRDALKILREHTNWVQIDIMDGKFVRNTSVSVFELGEAYAYFNLEFHLMVQSPELYFKDCDEMGAKRVIFHYEVVDDVREVLQKAKSHQFHIGVAVNPSTPVRSISTFIPRVDSVLLLSVNPGFQGQEFIPAVLEKVKEVREFSPEILIGMDGGINEENIKQVFQAGVDYVAVGSGIWQKKDPVETLKHLEEMVS